MDKDNLYMMNIADFGSAEPAIQKNEIVWWVLVIIEILLSIRLVLEFFDTRTGNMLAHVTYQVTDYILLPFTFMSFSVSGYSNQSLLIAVAILGYLVFAIAVVNLLNTKKTRYSRIERARAQSRRKYSY